MNKKKAQIQLTFHWIYILIAGAVILLFFAGIVLRQKVVAEESLERDVVRILESILIGAGVSEKTKRSVEMSGLSDYVFEFSCEEGYSSFGIKGGTAPPVEPLEPIFAPKEIKTTKLVLWSLPYKFPYKVMDVLMVSSVDTKYFVIGSDGRGFREELEKEMSEEEKEEDEVRFNFEFVDNWEEIDPGKNFHVRVVDLAGTIIAGSVPEKLNGMEDKQVSAVSFSGPKKAVYYQKKGDSWEKQSEVDIISIAEERDAARYGVVFAGDGESYECNMMKIFRRMKYVNEVYEGKLNGLKEYYATEGVPNKEDCQLILVEQVNSVETVFKMLGGAVSVCVLSGEYDSCIDMALRAGELKELNNDLHLNCIALY